MGSVKLDMSGWKGLEKTLKGNYTTRVGILGEKAARQNGETNKNNAEIGAIHELGLVAGIPQRSFLKYPLETKLFDKISAEKERYYLALKNGKMKNWFNAVGIWCEEIIDQAFVSGGFGSWAPNSPITITRKRSSKPLIDTGQLRASITSKVIEQ